LNHTPSTTLVPSVMRASIIVRLPRIRRRRTLMTVPPIVTSSPNGTAAMLNNCERSR
jgi:hypothetical protein